LFFVGLLKNVFRIFYHFNGGFIRYQIHDMISTKWYHQFDGFRQVSISRTVYFGWL